MAKPIGYILYDGPSLIDGAPIVVIATGFAGSHNRKTGAMIQTYILRSDVAPIAAIHAGLDSSVCGDCKHRGPTGDGKGRSCYVVVAQGPTVVYKAYKAGRYHIPWDYRAFAGRAVRFGAYGDPAAAPLEIWQGIAAVAATWTGYTHQWRNAPGFERYCMASVDTIEEASEAQSMGWRTFRVAAPNAVDKLPSEVSCPASAEAGRKLTCIACRACSGGNRRGNIVIKAHGGSAVMANAIRLYAEA